MRKWNILWSYLGFPGDAGGKEPACQDRRHETQGRSLGQEDPLKEGMATHSSILAREIPWTEEPGRLQSIGSQSRTRLRQLRMYTYMVLSRHGDLND